MKNILITFIIVLFVISCDDENSVSNFRDQPSNKLTVISTDTTYHGDTTRISTTYLMDEALLLNRDKALEHINFHQEMTDSLINRKNLDSTLYPNLPMVALHDYKDLMDSLELRVLDTLTPWTTNDVESIKNAIHAKRECTKVIDMLGSWLLGPRYHYDYFVRDDEFSAWRETEWSEYACKRLEDWWNGELD